MNGRRPRVRVGLALALALGVVGCGARGASEPTPAEVVAEGSAAAAIDEPAPASGEGVGEGEGEGEDEDAGEGTVASGRPPVVLPTPADAGACPAKGAGDPALGIMVSPQEPVAGAPMRVVAATLAEEAPLAIRVEREGAPLDLQITHRPGVPAAVIGALTPAAAGTITVIVGRDGVGIGCATIKVRSSAPAGPRAAGRAVWPLARTWSGAEEALFSAWVRELFHAEPGEDLAYRSLDEVTREADRNLLHNALAWDEDSAGSPAALRLRPDCADTPYFLRAYFAWKRGLPFAFRKCSRGTPGKAPRCGPPISNLSAEQGSGPQAGELGAVQHFFRRTLAWGVHTGNGRVALDDEGSDLYPVRLDRRGLRPGTVYADPYGHILVVSELVDPVGERPGILYAIDGQPDGSITRKRFWEGNFLWNSDPALGGSGFKSFRPAFRREVEGQSELVQLGDRELAELAGYGDVSMEQAKLDGVAFYDRMEALITPGTRDPFLALEEAVTALHEAAKVRVTSVDNGERHFAGGGGSIAMPEGYKIFETTGAWENFSTPARDLRLLVAIDLVNGFADKVRRQPEVFGVGPGPDQAERLARVIARLEARRAELVREPRFRFEYTRMDGSTQTVGLDELLGRAPALEMAYNPNECPELRWGAAEGSKEASTCRRRIPADQRAKMDRYRVWFRERRRPARGAMEP
ncbi:MAG: hypothetical protein H6711_07475 [Myxococcales bacterium]|nr:hypothetical protein [Myxococcales bacterium]